MLDLKEISYQPQTGERKIIDNLNLKVHENEIILICGISVVLGKQHYSK